MKISQFEQVLAVNKMGSINLAAEQLFMSQSQLSSSIKSLEQEIGADIFIRSNKGISLTPFGEEFVPYINSILLQIDQIKRTRQSTISKTKFTIVNGGFRFISDIISSLYTRHSSNGISIELHDYPGLKPIDTVSDRIADIGILRIWNHQRSIVMKQLNSKNLDFFLLGSMPLTVIVGPNNPLYYQKSDFIFIDQLIPYGSVQLNYMTQNPISSIDEKFPQLKYQGRISASSRSMLYEIISKTDLYFLTATPLSAYQKTTYYPNTRILTLKNSSYSAQIGWIKHKQYILSDLGNEFISMLSEYF